MVESKTAKQNILTSWFDYSSNAPKPSVSMTNISRFYVVGSGYIQTHKPFVQGLTVGPTPKIFFLSSITLFRR